MSEQKCGFIAIVGRPNVGKSTLLNRIIGHKVSITSKKAQTTKDFIKGILTLAGRQYIFVDTPGYQLKKSTIVDFREVLKDVDECILVLESNRYSQEDEKLAQVLGEVGKPLFIVVNKVDKLTRFQQAEVAAALKSRFPNTPLHFISAKHNPDFKVLLDSLAELLPEGPFLFNENDYSAQSLEFMVEELIREKVYRYLAQELPYAIRVQLESLSWDNNLVKVRALILVSKPSHKAIVIGKEGHTIKHLATKAREDLEKLLSSKVFLELRVKERP